MQDVFRLITRMAPSDRPVLILGETGTGKELVARAIHRHSPRCERRFVDVNCAAIPTSLFESEFFGHEPGAFTDAKSRRIGYFEQADRGTLFLDEVGEFSPEAQTKLLRVIERGEVTRLSGSKPVPVNVRIIAATNADLDGAMTRGVFRHLPLEAKHPRSFKAAEAAECSQRQGKFWQMHDAFFAEPMSLDTTSLFAKAHTAGLESARFRQCMNGEATGKVREDIAEARSFGITGVPTFLFGTIDQHGGLKVVRRESGTVPFEAFAQILDDLLEPNGTRQP